MVTGNHGRPAASARRTAVQDAVLRATAALLEEGTPYADVSIERIARGAGISRTAFYFYFHDKREVLLRLARDAAEQLYAEADVWFSGYGEAEPALRDVVRRVAAVYGEHGPVLRAVADGATSDEELGRFWNGILERFVDAARSRIEAEQRAGRAHVADAHATAFALACMTERTFHQNLAQGSPVGADALAGAVAELWRRGVYGA